MKNEALKEQTRNRVIHELQEFYRINGYTPSCVDMSYFSFSRDTTHRHFGGWNNALVLAGLPINMSISAPKNYNCCNCKKEFSKQNAQAKKTKNHFCSKSCAAVYNNKHKIHGVRRSKLETWLETELTNLYPQFEIHFNRKDTINSELDIYIPSLKVAFEINGIFHYEPIYGLDKLRSIQENDIKKKQKCCELGIILHSIDTTGMTYFKLSKAFSFLATLKSMIDSHV